MSRRNAEIIEKLHAQATRLRTSPMDLQNALQQHLLIQGKKQAFRRCPKKLRPRYE